MLYTRCPDCRTTFRITVETLHQADGRVRCGLCTSVFNAFEHLRDSVPDEERSLAASAGHASAVSRAAAALEARVSTGDPDDAGAETESAPPDRPADEPDEAVPAPEFSAPAAITDREVEEVLGQDDDEITDEPWPLGADPPRSSPSRIWRLAAALAAIALVAQAVHYFRAELAGIAMVGPIIDRAYAAAGAPITPRWNLGQYDIVDWTATAEENDAGQGMLRVVAAFRNVGPGAQPFPYFFLRLTDRWDTEIGSRAFRPEEYLLDGLGGGSMMPPGTNMRAELELIDPGPAAYGFEVDVCLEASAGRLRCKADLEFE